MEPKDTVHVVNWTDIRLKRKCLELICKIAARGEQTIEWAGVEYALEELTHFLHLAGTKGWYLDDPAQLLAELEELFNCQQELEESWREGRASVRIH